MEGLLDGLNEAFLTIDFGQGPLDFQIDTGFSEIPLSIESLRKGKP